MKTEKQKMLAGELYDATDTELTEDRLHARKLIRTYNECHEGDPNKLKNILQKLIPNQGCNLNIQAPFYCDYGSNITIGEDVYFNFNCVILDVMEVKIGSRSMFGPSVQIYTATHPINHIERATGLEFAKPITIGEDVWVGGHAVICPGVTIGDRVVIAAGSVVTKDVHDDIIVGGNPCKIISHLSE